MKRSMQEVVELVVFALIALLVGTGLVWLSGWILGLVGTLLTWLAGLVWSLLRFLVPVAVVAGLLVQFLTRSGERVARGPQEQPPTPPSPWTMSKEPPVAGDAGTAETQASDEPEETAEAGVSADEASAPDDAVASEPAERADGPAEVDDATEDEESDRRRDDASA